MGNETLISLNLLLNGRYVVQYMNQEPEVLDDDERFHVEQ
jgi:hypothetical protein